MTRASPVKVGSVLPPIRHVFEIVLENKSCAATFGANSPVPYLTRGLPRMGVVLLSPFIKPGTVSHQDHNHY